jgi:hypothetical protein
LPKDRQPPGADEPTVSCRLLTRATLILVALSLSSCRGCGNKTSALRAAPSLASVTVKPISGIVAFGQSLRVDGQPTQERLHAILDGAGIFASAEDKRPAAQVTLQAELIDATSSIEPAIGVKVRFRVAIRPPDSAATHFAEDVEGLGEAPLPNADAEKTRGAFQRLLERTSEDVAKAYVARQKLWEASPAELASALDSADSDSRVEALRIVAARKVPGQTERLLHLLADEDENVRDAAMGALVALRERRAVKVLTESRSMRDKREMQKILSAIAVLGGSEARDYLGFVAQNHDDDEVRAMAKQALDTLDRFPEHGRPTK